MSDDVVIRLRLADVAKFVADAKAGRIGLDELEKKIVSVGRVAKAESSSNYGGLGLYGATVGRIKYAVAGLALAAGAGAVALVGFALKSAASLEKVRMGFKQLLGSQGAADRFVSMLQDFAKRTPFNFQDVTTLAQKLLAFGAPAGQVKDDLTAIGNAVSAFGGSSADMDGIITALGQIAMKGHLAGQEVLQLNNHMINAKKYLMDALHVSGGQLDKLERAGRLSSSTVIPIILAGMQKQFGGMMDVQSQTLSGIANNLFDAFQQELVARVNPFMPTIKSWANWLLNHVGGIMDGVGKVLAVIGKFGYGIYQVATSQGAVRLFHDIWVAVEYIAGHIWWVGVLYNWLTAPGTSGVISNVLNTIAVFAENPVVQTFLTGIGGYAGAMWVLSAATDATAASMGRLKKAMAFMAVFTKAKVPTEMLGVGMGFRAVPALTGAAALKAFLPALFASTAIVGVAGALAYRFSAEFRKRWDGMWYDMTHGSWLSRIWGFVRGAGSFLGAAFVNGFEDSWSVVSDLWTLLKKWGNPVNVFDGLKPAFISVINWIIDRWNSAMDAMSFNVPGTSVGLHLGHAEHVSGAANGATTTSDGLLRVGERGPELLDLPRGANVIPLPRVPELLGAGRGGRPIHTHVILNGREIATAVHEASDDMAALR